MQSKADNDRSTRWFLLGCGLYLVVQAVLRVVMGGTMEADEAEMLLIGPNWAWGYGPQLPLFNWAQALVFQILGSGLVGLVVLKAVGLWLAFAGLWFAMRRAFDDRQAAAAAALSLFLLPNVLWEFQRVTSHSIAMLVAIVWTLWAWFRVMARPDLRNWLILGVMLGLGGLSKSNYWVLPIGLAVASVGFWPQRVDWRGPVAAVLVASLIVAVPYHWAVTHPAATLASSYKFYGDVAWAPPWVQGLGLLVGNMLVGLALAMIVGGALWIFAAWRRLGPAPMATQILLRVVVLSLAVAALLIVILGVSKVQARWLVPIQICALAAGFGWLGAALSPRAFRVLPIMAAICATVTVVGMAVHRLGPKGTLSMAPLVALTERLAPDRVEGDYLLAGNLKLLQPDRDIVPTGYTADRGDWPPRLLILGALPPGMTALDGGVLLLASPVQPDRPMRAEWHLVGPPG